MLKLIPTQLGDVLILETAQTFRVHAIGVVAAAGQQDFHARSQTVKYLRTQTTALAVRGDTHCRVLAGFY